MPRWFVTGAGGQLATAFAALLPREEVVLSSEAELDIRDRRALRAAVAAAAPEVVLHCAAWTDVDGAERDPRGAASVNVEGTRNLVDALRGSGATLVYFSTDYVFDGTKGSPYVESDAPNPLNVYGRTKLEGERRVLTYERGIVVRTAWLYSEHGHNFVRTIFRAACERHGGGEPLRVVDDQVGSPTYAPHLAAAVLEALAAGLEPGLCHLAGGGWCSWYELAREVVALAGYDVRVEPLASAELGRPARRPAFSALASERPVPRLPHWLDGVRAAVDRLRGSGGRLTAGRDGRPLPFAGRPPGQAPEAPGGGTT